MLSFEMIANSFYDHFKKEGEINADIVSKKNPGLYRAILRHCFNYYDFLRILGYDNLLKGNTDIMVKWTKEKIKKEFIKYKDEGNPIQYKQIREINSNLYFLIYRYYGSYKLLLDELNIDSENLYGKQKMWSKEMVISELQKRIDEGLDISPSCLLKENSSLISNMRNLFVSYKETVEEIGLNYEDCIKDNVYTRKLGYVFEDLVRIMYEKLELNYIYHYSKFPNCVVDFYDLNNEEIIDAKLSSWSVFFSDTVQKYSPLCKVLTIIFLRGEYIKHNHEKLKFIKIDEYYPILRKNKLEWLIDDFENLKKRVKFEEYIDKQKEGKKLTIKEINDAKKTLEQNVNDSASLAASKALYNEIIYLRKEINSLRKETKENIHI